LAYDAVSAARTSCSTGAFFFIHLPNSHIEIDPPLIGTFAGEPRLNGGLSPDIESAATRPDVAKGVDLVLQRALDETP